MAAGLYVLDARAVVQRRNQPLPNSATVALCDTAPPAEGGLKGELSNLDGYRRQRVDFGPPDSRRRRAGTLRNRRRVTFGPIAAAWPDRLFAVVLDDADQPVAWGRLKQVSEPEGCEFIQFEPACIKLMSGAFTA